MSKVRSAAIAVSMIASLVAMTGTSAEAATDVTIHTIAGKTIKKGATTTVKPNVTHKSRVAISSTTVTAKRGHTTLVRHKVSARLRAGTYRVTTDVFYRTWNMVTKTRQVRARTYGAGTVVSSKCSVSGATAIDALTAHLALRCHAAGFDSTPYASTIIAASNGGGRWTVTFHNSLTQTLSSADLAGLKNQTVNGSITAQQTLYRLASQKYQARRYSANHHKSKTQTLKIKSKKSTPKHSCTKTSKGTCIAGGQFCPQAKYSKSGWDAAGRRYVCKGDHTHPHWMKP